MLCTSLRYSLCLFLITLVALLGSPLVLEGNVYRPDIALSAATRVFIFIPLILVAFYSVWSILRYGAALTALIVGCIAVLFSLFAILGVFLKLGVQPNLNAYLLLFFKPGIAITASSLATRLLCKEAAHSNWRY